MRASKQTNASGDTTETLRSSLWRRLAALVAVTLVALPVVEVPLAPSASALSTPAATFSPAAVKTGATVGLQVTTSNDVDCVSVTGAVTGSQVFTGNRTVWNLSFTAPSGDGTKTATVTAFTSATCSGTSKSTTATFTVDNTKPTITASASPAPNSSGWNNSNVTVTFTCADTGGSGVASCTSPVTLVEGANQSATGTATDKAGNSATATVSNINIDETKPTLTGAPTTSPNGSGWYNSNVSIAWTCGDALSGIPSGTCPANSTITGEGQGLSAGASVSDAAGNTTTATSPAVKIDRTAPVTTANAPPSWNNTDVTVTLSPTDNLSQVAATHYIVDGAATQTGTSVAFTTEGDHTLSFWSVDNAGNVETAHTAHIKIDKTPPTISDTKSPSHNNAGWNNSDVTVTFTCADSGGSGLASCTTAQTVTTEGADIPVTGTATDNAGNTATDPATVSIDKTAPTITGSPDRAPNTSGWYNAPVTVTYSCADQPGLSGVASCPSAKTLTEGANQSASGTAADAAGNTTTGGPTGINIDMTAPALTGAPTTAPDSDGWYYGDVTIHWTCSDTLSGLAGSCPADTVITGQGADLTASASVTDRAGNTTTASSVPVNIDRTAPVTTSDAPSSWQTSGTTVHLAATDNLSGVAATYFTLDGGSVQPGTNVAVSTDGQHTITFWSVDHAGNTETAHAAEVDVDTTAPTIGHTQSPAANTNGWNNSDVTVTFDCADPAGASGLASCTGPQTLTAEGQNLTTTGTATDVAGNSATDTATANIDKTAPTISASADRAANANGWYNAPVTVSYTCDDQPGLSGVASCSISTTLYEGLNQSATGTAVDNAGNQNTATLSGINVDTTAPTISGAPTTAANSAGWYNGDVSIAWSCGDNLSGIAGSCPANSTITGEGQDLSAGASVADRAGNTSSATVGNIQIDRTAPTTTADAPSDWTNTDVTVALHPSDGLSGVAATYYTLDGGSQQAGTAIPITTEGTHSISYWSVDNAGNVETPHSGTVKIDKTAPTISHALSPAPNGAGWNNADVTVTFTCDDGLSGIASCTQAATVTSEGAQQPVSGLAVDNAGNSTPDTAYVSIDKTPPTVTATMDRPPNGNGWYNASATAKFLCSDQAGLSGIAACPTDWTFAEGAGQSIQGTAEDAAGNTASAGVSGINVDLTPPSLSGAPTTGPNGAGWYNGDVTIHWDCSDALSGIDGSCPANSTISSEGTGLTASASVADKAGNKASATSTPGVNIDRTAPLTTSDAPSGWVNHDVTVALSPSDSLSGVAATYYTVDGGQAQAGTSVQLTQGAHTLTFWSVDEAGNSEAHQTVSVDIDTTPPSIGHTQAPGPNSKGWNNTDVTVHFDCADQAGLSGVSSCSADQTLTNEGQGQAVTGTASDYAGNTATDTATVSIDKTPPTILASTDRAANSNGWYGAPVKVSYSCGDTLSGVADCPATTTLQEGASQSASGTATDVAGNTATAGVEGINVDMTAPVLTGAPTTQPNADGWYNGNVLVHWTCSDALSGIDGNCPADSVIAGEGPGLGATTSVADKAGNVTKAEVTGIKIDRTAPSTTANPPSGWVNNDVTVTLTPTDGLSGVATTYYILDSGPTHTGTSVSVNSEGTHTLSFWSVDHAGNAEAANSATIQIDKTAPTITDSQSPAVNAKGWNNSEVTVTFTCNDAMSGIASCTGPQKVTTEGQSQPVIGQAVDNAGNTAGDTATVSIDKTPPIISGAPDRPANGNGWYNAPVKVAYTCTDQQGLSGIASCSDPTTLHEGAGQSVTGTATDAAGNSASATVSGLNIDMTAPTISGAATTAPNANGWYNSDVTIHWTCSDALSGIDGSCPADSVIAGEGSNLGTTATVYDKAGNAATATIAGIQIDRHAPTTDGGATALIAPSWSNKDVTVKLTANDNLSGVDTTYYSVDGGPQQTGTSVTVTTQGVNTVLFWSVDRAGNVETKHSDTVEIDKTPPTITGAPTTSPNSSGWYHSPVTVKFTCDDQIGLSGLASCLPQTSTLSADGANQSVTGTATDVAGNSTTATVGGINIDTTKPTVTINGVTSGASYILGNVPTPSCTASDSLSGLAGTCTGTVTGGLVNGVGTYTYTATATDKAGNTNTVSATYAVDYQWSGFLQPINDTAHQTGVQTSIFKAGSTVPVKFQLKNASGGVAQAVSTPQWLAPVKGSSTNAAPDETVYGGSTSSGSSFSWDASGQQYIYTWSTKGLVAGYYYRIGVRLDDGTTYYVNIGLR